MVLVLAIVLVIVLVLVLVLVLVIEASVCKLIAFLAESSVYYQLQLAGRALGNAQCHA
jgi:hypothetical protein